MHEVHGEDGFGLHGEELAPGRTRPARCRVNTGVVEDLPHRGGGNAMAEPDQFALHPPVPPGRILGCHADNKLLDRRRGRWTSELAVCGVVPLARDQPAVPDQDRGRSHREDLRPAARRGTRRDKAASHTRSAGLHRIKRTDVAREADQW
jgi:hypothetical protein